MADKSGWERMLYIGTAGSTATTLVDTAIDVGLDKGGGFHSTTTRGDGTSIPKETERQHSISRAPTFSFLRDSTDTPQNTILAAIDAGNEIAVKIIEASGGSTEFDGDCGLEKTSPGPIADGMTVEVTCHPTRTSRAWS